MLSMYNMNWKYAAGTAFRADKKWVGFVGRKLSYNINNDYLILKNKSKLQYVLNLHVNNLSKGEEK